MCPADELAAWLDRFADRDNVAAEQIAEARERQAAERSFVEDNVATLSAGLSNMQDSIEQRLETSLSAISDALNKLNRSADGFGADLTWRVTRPQSVDGTWSWAVTPRATLSPRSARHPRGDVRPSALALRPAAAHRARGLDHLGRDTNRNVAAKAHHAAGTETPRATRDTLRTKLIPDRYRLAGFLQLPPLRRLIVVPHVVSLQPRTASRRPHASGP